MLIHNFWEAVLGSKVKIKILRVLSKYPTKKFTIRELARLMHCAHTPVLKSLSDLQGMNLIGIEKHGTANMIHFNTQSHLAAPIQKIFATETDLKSELKQKISKIVPKAKMVALFGSMVQGNENMNSDIDVLIITNDKNKMKRALEEARKNLSEEFGNLISPLVLTEKEFKTSKNRPFAQDLKYNYEIIAGEDFIKRWWIDDKNKKC